MIAVFLGVFFGFLSCIGAMFTFLAFRVGWIVVIIKAVIDIVAGLTILVVLWNSFLTTIFLLGLGILGLILTVITACVSRALME